MISQTTCFRGQSPCLIAAGDEMPEMMPPTAETRWADSFLGEYAWLRWYNYIIVSLFYLKEHVYDKPYKQFSAGKRS